MTKPNVLPVCYFPTTVYLVEDNVVYSRLFEKSLRDEFIITIENNPQTALNYFNNKYHPDPFWSNWFTKIMSKNSKKISVDVSNIYKQIYNKDRFKQIAVIISDYAMPELTGLELFQKIQINNKLTNPAIKFVMLTGEIESPASLLEYIDAFYKKTDPIEKLIQKVHASQKAFFQDASLGLISALTTDAENKGLFFTDKKFIDLHQTILHENNIIEYYLWDKHGSQLLLDREANLTWLLVCNEQRVRDSIELARKYSAPTNVLDSLKQHQKILFIPDEKKLKKNSIRWEDYLHACEILKGQETYYYTYTPAVKHHNIEKDKILSFEKYLQGTA